MKNCIIAILFFSLIIFTCNLNNDKPLVNIEIETDNDYNLILLPTHAEIINDVEKLGASNVRIIHYEVFVPFLPCQDVPSPFLGDYYYRAVPSDSSFYAVQGNLATTPRLIKLHYEYSGLGSIITSNDVENTVKSLFSQHGFGYTDVSAAGTMINASFPLPSYNQIKQSAEQAGVTNIQINTYNADNKDVIPLNEGSRLVDKPIIVSINYNGKVIPAVTDNIKTLFSNFNNVHIGNNETAIISLPSPLMIKQTAAYGAWFSSGLYEEPHIYSVDDVNIITICDIGNATWGELREWVAGGTRPSNISLNPEEVAWNSKIKLVLNGNGYNTSVVADNARLEIIKLFNNLGFLNLDITVNR